MTTEEEKVEKIKRIFFENTKQNELSTFDASSYFARQIMSEESFFLKRNVTEDLIEKGYIVVDNEKWIIKKVWKNEFTKVANKLLWLNYMI